MSQLNEQPKIWQLKCFSHDGFMALLKMVSNVDQVQLKASSDNIRQEAKADGVNMTRTESKQIAMSLLSGNLGMRFYQYIPHHVKERLVYFPDINKALMEARNYLEMIHASECLIVH